MTDKDELAALKARVEELERAANPPKEKPFVPQPYQRYDPTAGMSMPMSTMLEMHRAAGHVMGGVLHDNRAPTSPSTIPRSQQVSNAGGGAAPRGGTGWGAATPLSPPPGVAQADKLMDAQDRRDRIELAHRIAAHEAAMRAAQKERG